MISEPTPAEVKPKPRRGAETILLVEDETGVRKLTRRILEQQGYKLLEAADGAEAIARWEENPGAIALLFTDLVMPGGLNGQELARRLVLQQPELKVIYTSGYSEDIAGKDFQLRKGEVFIQKPAQSELLLATIRQCLDE
jgi:CheY-like chemotaxis protein